MRRSGIVVFVAVCAVAVVVAAVLGGAAPAVGVAVVGLLGPIVFFYRYQETRPAAAQRPLLRRRQVPPSR